MVYGERGAVGDRVDTESTENPLVMIEKDPGSISWPTHAYTIIL